MRYLLMLLLLTSCKYNPQNIKYGDRVKVVDGFYQGHRGRVVDSHSWMGPCQHKFYIDFDTINKSDFISVCDLEKEK